MLGKLLRNIFGHGGSRPQPAPNATHAARQPGGAQPDVPSDAQPTTDAGAAYDAMVRGDYAHAHELYSAIVKNNALDYEALANLGLCHAGLGRYEEAKECLEAVLRAAPGRPLSAIAHINLGNIALTRHHFTESAEHYEKALALSVPTPGLLNNMGLAMSRRGFADLAIARYREALALQPDYQDAHSNLLFAMQHAPGTRPQELFDEFRGWSERHERPLAALPRKHANDRDPERRLRVGYVSGDFLKHAVSNFFEPVLANHDKTRVDAFCYFTRDSADEQTAILRGMAGHWRDVAALSDDALAEQVRADGIDILVDLASHTLGHRLLAFARKPAPLQMTWLGYPTTTGLAAMDYRISDAVSDPPGVAEAWHSERLLYLPRTQWCYRPDRAAPAVAVLPALANGHITFGSFNNLSKLNENVLSLWARVLRALPAARINVACIPDLPSRHRIAERLIAHGAHPAQITVTGTMPYAEFWRIRDDIDIVLDAHPYNGTTTTCEALWAGLPVVTLAGGYGASRSATAILTSVGLDSLVARDEDDYVRIACALAGDVEKLAALRRGMRERLVGAGLCDGARFTRELEGLYRQAWRTWCAEAPPGSG